MLVSFSGEMNSQALNNLFYITSFFCCGFLILPGKTNGAQTNARHHNTKQALKLV